MVFPAARVDQLVRIDKRLQSRSASCRPIVRLSAASIADQDDAHELGLSTESRQGQERSEVRGQRSEMRVLTSCFPHAASF